MTIPFPHSLEPTLSSKNPLPTVTVMITLIGGMESVI